MGALKVPLVVIVGPTASGKSDLAIRLAKKYNGEIICADSQTIRRGMDIGTAKPTAAQRVDISHHLLDIIEPYETFSAAVFKKLANHKIEEISQRGKLPILVGGTGLFIDSVLFDFTFRKTGDKRLRSVLENKSVLELQEIIVNKNLPMPSNLNNPRHLIRTIETLGEESKRNALRENTLVLGLNPGKDILDKRITERVERMFAEGFIEEVKVLVDQYGQPPRNIDAIGYRIVLNCMDEHGNVDEVSAKKAFISADKKYAKRQLTWFKRNEHIHWVSSESEAGDILRTFLKK